jgi:hypothetical protein
MNSDSSSPLQRREGSADDEVWRTEVRHHARDGTQIATHIPSGEPLPFPTIFAHDEAGCLFVVTRRDRKTEHYRDRAVRHLIVEPDPDTGEMRPVAVPCCHSVP